MADKSHISLARVYNKKFFKLRGVIHEQISSINGGHEPTGQIPITVNHNGYLYRTDENIRRKLLNYEKLLESELKKSPNDPYLLYQLGKRFFFKGDDYKKACQYFKKALENSPGFASGYIYNTVECYGYALINSGQYKTAYALIREYGKYYNDMAAFRFLSAHVFQNNGMFREAVESYRSCIGAREQDYKGITSYLPYYNIGVIFECLGMSADAREMYLMCGDFPKAKERLKSLGT
jgi:tetratricopeptide (TPR) repeat protein